MKNKYRVVTDAYAGYEAQIKYWWCPFGWWQVGINTHHSIERAKVLIQKHKGSVVWESDPVKEAKRIIKESKHER